MRILQRSILLLLTLGLLACTPLEQSARNTAAALQGALTAAQTQYQSTCTTNAKQPACVAINEAIAGENALVTATEAYCGWKAGTIAPGTTLSAACVPVKSAAAGLTQAIANANLFITELKGVIQ
jgi:hypothetical protein